MKLSLSVLLGALALCFSYTPSSQNSKTISRRNVFDAVTKSCVSSAFLAQQQQQPALAFDGAGSSAYAGRTPATKAALVKGYKSRIAADVKDFNALGQAIAKGETDGNEWVAFFIPYQRREPDDVGRTYAAMIDLVGMDKDRSGGCGMLLASTFAKPNKPPDNLPQVKAFNALAKELGPIEKAGKAGDVDKASKAFAKASAAFSDYLATVDMPSSLTDELYQS